MNEGNVYNVSTGMVNIAVKGVYYISTNAGVTGGKRMLVRIMVDGVNRGTLARLGTWHNNKDTLSKSITIELEVGAVVSVYADSGSPQDMFIWSDSVYKVTSFMGMLM